MKGGKTFYDFSAVDIDVRFFEKAWNIFLKYKLVLQGRRVKMSEFAGRLILIVNVDSNWGLTMSNYAQLVELHK